MFPHPPSPGLPLPYDGTDQRVSYVHDTGSLMGIDTFDDDYRIDRLERCAISVAMRRPVHITGTDALRILQTSFDLTGHRPYVVLVDTALVLGITPEARRNLSSARNVLATAMLGHSPMDRVLSAPYEHAVYPCEYFTEHQSALDWLCLIHDLLCGDPVEHTMTLTVDLDPFRRRPGAALHILEGGTTDHINGTRA